MVINKRSKNSRQRATTTHGWGSMKKHRGAGNRGGRGNAGSGKRGDAKKASYWGAKYFGKYGFKKVNKKVSKCANIKLIEDSMKTFLNAGLAKKEGDFYLVNLADIGYDKLLAAGKVTMKLKLTVQAASKSAIEKVEAAGGEVAVSK